MRFGMCVSIDDISAAADAGFDYVEMSSGALFPAQDDASFADFLRRAQAAPLRIEAFNCFLPAAIRVTGPNTDLRALESHARIVLGRAQRAGASVMVFGSGGARRMEAGEVEDRAWKQLAEAAAVVAEVAEDCGMMITMEPLAPPSCNFFTRVDQGMAFVDRVNHPSLKLLADLFHVQKSQEPVVNVAHAGRRLAHVHLATPTVAGLASPPVPYDFAGYFKALRDAGYSGRISVEDNPGLLRNIQRPFTPVFTAIREYLRELAG